MKTCVRCGTPKPVDQFWKSKNGTQGLHAYCKACGREVATQYRAKNREKVNAQERARRHAKGTPGLDYIAYLDGLFSEGKHYCNRCQQEKPLTDFNKNRSTRLGIQTYCKDCRKALSRAYYLVHKEVMIENNRQWRKRRRALTQ